MYNYIADGCQYSKTDKTVCLLCIQEYCPSLRGIFLKSGHNQNNYDKNVLFQGHFILLLLAVRQALLSTHEYLCPMAAHAVISSHEMDRKLKTKLVARFTE